MRYVATIFGILVVVGTLAAIKATQIGKLVANGKQMEQAGPPPESVSTARADEQPWEGTLTAVGTVASDKGVAVSNDTAGVVTKIQFESGATVKQGQVLVELETNVERAQLASAMARRSLAATTAERSRNLVATGAIAQSVLDADEATLRTATTDADAIQAQIARKTVRAPFSGRLGIRAVNLGQYLNSGTPITVLETIDPVHVDFTLPQQRLAEVAIGMPVRILLEVEAAAPLTGAIAAFDPAIETTTRSINARADVPNKEERLRPGMFVNVTVVLPRATTFVTVPATAVVHATFGDSVLIVEDKKPDAPGMRTTPDGKPVKIARQQFVRTGPARGDFVAVLEGLSKGQEVVTAGAFKLRNGSPVVVDNTKQAEPQLAPKPPNR